MNDRLSLSTPPLSDRISQVLAALAEEDVQPNLDSMRLASDFLESLDTPHRPSVFARPDGLFRLLWRHEGRQFAVTFLPEGQAQVVLGDLNPPSSLDGVVSSVADLHSLLAGSGLEDIVLAGSVAHEAEAISGEEK